MKYLKNFKLLYLIVKQNGFGKFFDLNLKEVFEINDNYLAFRADSFRDKLDNLFTCKIKCLYNDNILNNSLRIYEIIIDNS